MTSLLQSKTKEDYASESVLVEQGGENLVLSLGNLLHSTAQKDSVISKTKETVEKRTKVNTSCGNQLCFSRMKRFACVFSSIKRENLSTRNKKNLC